ncbi:MAG: hypothetical protein JO356_08995, partial [Acidobacteria bacterium]|nr:hypothetical protein [Acidobacteriota bacterium]
MSGLLLALLTSLVLWYTTTPSFERRVRRRLIVAIERASGGRAELSRFRVVPFRFQVEIEGLTIHGREQPGDVPLTQIDRVSAVVNLRTLLGGNFGFHSLALDHPVIHLIWYADGSSNRPRPQPSTAANFEHLFSISIDKLSITRGELLWQDHRIPLNFALNDLTGGLDYSFLRREYSGTVSLGHAETHLSRQPPVVWAGQSAFTIGQDKITFQGLKLSAAGSWLEARGELTNFNDPHLTADYNLALNLLQAGAILGQSQLKAGRLDLAGNASWATDNFLCSGRFAIAGLSWKDSRLTLNNASAGGKFSLNPSKLTLSQVQGLILGGSFTSEVEMSGWQSVALKKNPGKNGQSGSIKVRIKEISLAELMASLAGQSRAFTSVGLRGSVWGAADLRWKNAIQDAELSLGLNVSPPGHTSPNEIPVNAIVNGTYNVRNGDATIRELFLSTPASSLRATGTLARRGLVRLA